jgi:hypothetical protein
MGRYKGVACLLVVGLFIVVAVPSHAESEPAKEEYELAERCGKLSREYFNENISHPNGGFSTFQNHYNKKLNKCFYLQTTYWAPKDNDGKEKVTTFSRLVDINENDEYGSITDGETLKCRTLDKICHSNKEWFSFIAPYLNE